MSLSVMQPQMIFMMGWKMYLSLHIDDDEALGEISDQKLIAEMKRRNLKKETDLDMSEIEKCFQLRSAALELRKHNKLSYAVWLEDIAQDIGK